MWNNKYNKNMKEILKSIKQGINFIFKGIGIPSKYSCNIFCCIFPTSSEKKRCKNRANYVQTKQECLGEGSKFII